MRGIVAAFISDRADLYLPRCLESFEAHITGVGVTDRVMVDDRDHELGMAGAVRAAWQQALDLDCDFVFHAEEDFLFTQPVDLADLADLLAAHPELAQLVLKRQPWNSKEITAGGIIESRPELYLQRDGYVEHARIFSLNPCLLPREVLELGWPDGNEAEFTQICLDKGYRFAFYGNRDDPPRCFHIGYQRSEGWRL